MNMFMVKKLIAKDWYFFRYILAAYLTGGLASLALMFSGSEAGAVIGPILIVTIIISLGCHLVMGSVVQERQQQTLSFVMSLPISAKEYTLSKLVANVSIFLVLWVVISTILVNIVVASDGAPNGLIPLFTIMLVEMFIAYLIMLTTAMISESEGWTIVSMVVCNTAFSLVFMGLNAVEGIGNYRDGAVAMWTNEVFMVLGLEAALIIGIISMTFYLQNKKADFI